MLEVVGGHPTSEWSVALAYLMLPGAVAPKPPTPPGPPNNGSTRKPSVIAEVFAVIGIVGTLQIIVLIHHFVKWAWMMFQWGRRAWFEYWVIQPSEEPEPGQGFRTPPRRGVLTQILDSALTP